LQGEPIPSNLYTAAQVRALDRYAIEQCQLGGYELMQRAASAIVKLLRFRWPRARRVAVICGSGNNGGDGLVVSRLLLSVGLSVKTGLHGSGEALKNESRHAFEDFIDAGGELHPVDACIDEGTEIVIDALFGSGLSRPIEGRAAAIIATMNRSQANIIAVDVPSGLCSTTGAVLGTAVRASATLTFIAGKCGLLTADGPDFTGSLFFDNLGVPDEVYHSTVPSARCISSLQQIEPFCARSKATHKGQCGSVLLVGGNVGYGGAIRLSARACLRTGAGRVTVICHPKNGDVDTVTPEVMVKTTTSQETLQPEIEACDVIAIGPGLGTDDWARGLLGTVLRSGKPLVLDADALNLLNEFSVAVPKNSVLTPHPQEAGRLLSIDTKEIQSDRFAAVANLAHKYSATALLKGNGTLVCGGGKTTLIAAGNPDMATAGMGDALTGFVASFIGQGMPAKQAAVAAATLHAQAGDMASGKFGRGLIASDVIEFAAKLLACR
jgi:hydroxyethylthiazole kinase-like uncharacterized protein yjeF